MYDPRHRHWISTKHVLRYLRGTFYYKLRYASISEVNLLAYAKSNQDGSIAASTIEAKVYRSYYYNLLKSCLDWEATCQVV